MCYFLAHYSYRNNRVKSNHNHFQHSYKKAPLRKSKKSSPAKSLSSDASSYHHRYHCYHCYSSSHPLTHGSDSHSWNGVCDACHGCRGCFLHTQDTILPPRCPHSCLRGWSQSSESCRRGSCRRANLSGGMRSGVSSLSCASCAFLLGRWRRLRLRPCRGVCRMCRLLLDFGVVSILSLCGGRGK